MKKRISIWIAMIMIMEICAPSILGIGTSMSVNAAGTQVIYNNPAEQYITSLLPANGARGVAPTTKLQVKFNHAVTIQTGTLQIVDTSLLNPSSPINISVTDPDRVTVSSPTEIEINLLPNQLLFNKTYELSIHSGAFSDTALSTTIPEIKWGFRTISSLTNTPPTITQYTPINGKADIEPNLAELQLLFNEEVLLGTGTIHIRNKSDDVEVEAINIQAGQSQAVSINPTNPSLVSIQTSKLGQSSDYYVIISANTFTDLDGAPFAGILTKNQWGFRTKGAPTVLSQTSPTDGATAVPINTPIQLTFSQNVRIGSGNITIRQAGSLNVESNIPVFSSRVTGAGTNRIVITPDITLQNNKQYMVSVPAGAFLDNGNNPVPSNSVSWTFTSIGDSSALREMSVSPANGSIGVPLSTDLTVTFNRSVKAANGMDNAQIKLYNATTSQMMSVNMAVNPSNLAQIRSVNKVTLDQNSSYYVVIDNGVFVDRVNASIVYSGLNGNTNWNFKTNSTDKIAPVLQSTQMHNASTIRLTYNEALSYSSYLNNSNFAVTVNGESRRAIQVYTSGESVYIVLEIGVSVGQNVKVSYTSGNAGIMDVAMNPAASFTLRDVTNGIDSALPKPREGTGYGTTIHLSFNETLKTPSTNAYQQFTVTADGTSVGVRSMVLSGSSLVFTLTNSITDGQVIKISYTPGLYPIQDYRGMNMSAFSDFYVRNQVDTKPPIFMGAEGSGNKVVLKYNEALKSDNLPMKSQFSVLVNKTPNYVTGVTINGNLVELTLATTLTSSQEVSVSYVPGVGSQRITDLSGNSAGYINLAPMGVGTSSIHADVKSATIKADTLTIEFSKSISSTLSSSALNTMFLVRVDNNIRTIQSTILSGDKVTLHISPEANVGQTVQVSYNGGSGALKDLQGVAITSFSNLNVQNTAGKNDVITGSLAILDKNEFGEPMYILPTSAAASSESRTKFNQITRRYLIDAAQLKSAFEQVLVTSTSSKTLVFEVPTYEKAAYVGIPLQSLQQAILRDNKARFAVRSGDHMYILPLSSLDMTEINRSLASATSTVIVWVQVEKVPSQTASDLSTKISGVGGQVIVESTDFYISAVNNTTSKSVPLNIKGEYLIRTTKPVPDYTTAFVYYDASVAQISFIPTVNRKFNSYTVLHGKVTGNYTVTGVTGSKFYADINGHWANEAINELLAKYIIDGRTPSSFVPNSQITRGEFAVYMARALALPSDTQTTTKFKDVQGYSVMGTYIGAAAKAGIITGNTDGTFRADSYITREQMSIMMVRAMDYAGLKQTVTTSSSTVLAPFKDRSKIQSPLTVARAVQAGIIVGTTTTTFQPQGNATRAQASVMLKRLLNKIGYM
ncbi:Ig-like domain-containing protein [Paenibacillus sp. CMAA1364]